MFTFIAGPSALLGQWHPVSSWVPLWASLLLGAHQDGGFPFGFPSKPSKQGPPKKRHTPEWPAQQLDLGYLLDRPGSAVERHERDRQRSGRMLRDPLVAKGAGSHRCVGHLQREWVGMDPVGPLQGNHQGMVYKFISVIPFRIPYGTSKKGGCLHRLQLLREVLDRI